MSLCAGLPAAAATLEPGEDFPALNDFALIGELPDLSDARVTIVDFWASWCAPCKASFPVFDELQQEYGDQGLVIVAVSVDQNERAMKAFLERHRPQFAVVHDAKQELVSRVDVPSMPTSFVLDADGTVRFVHVGFHGDASRRQYREQIQTLLSETP